jgi:integrase-like protein
METLADLSDRIRGAGLPQRRMQDICAALKTAARALGKPPDRIAADLARLMLQLQKVPPSSIGLTGATLANVRSLIRAGFAVAAVTPERRRIHVLSDDWNPLYQQLDRWGKLKLSRFLRFLSAQGEGPDTVTEGSFAAYRAHLDDVGLACPDKIHNAVIDGWRKAQVAVPGWPSFQITRINRRRDWTLGWSSFPPSLRNDWQAWCDRQTDPLGEIPLRPVKPGTIKAREWQVLASATALVNRGRDPSTVSSLRDLVEIEPFKEILRFLVERYGGITHTVYDLAVTLKGLARHHVQMDQVYLDRMAAIIRRLDVGKSGLTEKNQARLRQFGDPKKLDSLLLLPKTLMQEADRDPKTHKSAIKAQTAVQIEILQVIQARLKNVAELDLAKNFVALGNEMLVVIGADSVKNQQPIERPLPIETVQLIQHYLTKFWPRLAPAGCTALFPGRNGGPKSPNAVRDQICKTIRRYIGAEMNPHLFRHLGSKNHLDECPGDYETVRLSLGHKSIATTRKFYTGLEAPAAYRHYDKTILKMRERAKSNEQASSSRPRTAVQADRRVAGPRPGPVGGRPGPGRPVRGRRR